MKETLAITGFVTGNVQRVGFRAMIMKQAIQYNLAGTARNLPDSVVKFTLQGRSKRLDDAVATIELGTAKSSNVRVRTEPTAVSEGLRTFTIFAWTSTSRNITNPYDLVFHLRADDGKVSPGVAKDVWHGILRSTLRGEDLEKLDPDD